MLKVSRRLNYGLQLMIALASDTENTSKSTAAISEQLAIGHPRIAGLLRHCSFLRPNFFPQRD